VSASEAAPADLSGVRRIEPFFCEADHTDPGEDYTHSGKRGYGTLQKLQRRANERHGPTVERRGLCPHGLLCSSASPDGPGTLGNPGTKS
jgi:hypothetical protein